MATKLKEVDAVIVGLGWTGGILAKELAAAGLKVVALERGAMRSTDKDFALPNVRDELRYVVRHELMQNTARDTLTVRNNPSQEALPMRRLGAARQQQGVAEHDDVLGAPQVEMADPELLVDPRDELQDLQAAAIRHFEVERAGDMERLHVLDPGEGDVVFAPAPGHRDGHLVGLGAVENPVADRGEPFDDVEGVFRPIDVFDVKLSHCHCLGLTQSGSGERRP